MLCNWFGKHIWVRRFISSVVTVAFLSCAVLDDVWAAIKPGDASCNLPAVSLGENKFRPIKANKFYLPEHLGRVESFFKGKSKKTVFHIQDAHCNSFAQHKIAEIIDYLKKTHDISVLNLEGAAGEFDLDVFTSIKDQEKRREIADYFVKAGEISGPEFYAINNPEKVTLWGIEDKNLYLKNLKAYHDFLKHEEEVNGYLEELTRGLDLLKKCIFTPELLELDKMCNEYKSGNLGFREYSDFLIQKAKEYAFPVEKFNNLYLLQRAIEKEKHIDFKKANAERAIIIDELEKVLSRDEMRELVKNIIRFKTEKMSEKKFYRFILKKARSIGLETQNFFALSCYLEYISLYDQIDFLSVSENIDMLEAEIKESLCRNPDQREMIMLSRNLALMKNIFRIALTNSDYQYYLKNKKSFDAGNYLEFIKKNAVVYKIDMQINKHIGKLDEYRERIVKFYEYSFKRDKAFLKNLRFVDGKTNDENTLLVTGGFHSENLYKLLRKQNISYVSISPKFISEKDYKSPYFDLLTGGQGTNLQYVVSAFISNVTKISMLALTPKLAPVISQIVCGNNKVDAFKVSAKLMDKEGLEFVLGIKDIKLEGDFIVFYMEDGTIEKKPKDYMMVFIEEVLSREDREKDTSSFVDHNNATMNPIPKASSTAWEDNVSEESAREIVSSLKNFPEYKEQVLKSGIIENEIDIILERLQIDVPNKIRKKLYKSVLPATRWSVLKTAFFKGISHKEFFLGSGLAALVTKWVFSKIRILSLNFLYIFVAILIFSYIYETYNSYSKIKDVLSPEGQMLGDFIWIPVFNIKENERDLKLLKIRFTVAHELIHLLTEWDYLKDEHFMATVVLELRRKELNPFQEVKVEFEEHIEQIINDGIEDEKVEEVIDKLLLGEQFRTALFVYEESKKSYAEPPWIYIKGFLIAKYLCRKYDDENRDKRWEYLRERLNQQKSKTASPEVVFSLEEAPGYDEQILNSGIIKDEIDTILKRLQLNLSEKEREQLYKSAVPATRRNISKLILKTGLVVALLEIILSILVGVIKSSIWGLVMCGGTLFLTITGVIFKGYSIKRKFLMNRWCGCTFLGKMLFRIYKLGKNEYASVNDIRISIAHELIHKLAEIGYVKDVKFMATTVEVLQAKELSPDVQYSITAMEDEYINKLVEKHISHEELEEEVDKFLFGNEGYKWELLKYKVFKWINPEPDWMYDKGRIIAEYLCRKYDDENRYKCWECVRSHLFQKKCPVFSKIVNVIDIVLVSIFVTVEYLWHKYTNQNSTKPRKVEKLADSMPETLFEIPKYDISKVIVGGAEINLKDFPEYEALVSMPGITEENIFEIVFNLKNSPEYEETVLKSGIIEDEINMVLKKLHIDLSQKKKEKLYKSVLPGTNWNILKTIFTSFLRKKIFIVSGLITLFSQGRRMSFFGFIYTFAAAFVLVCFFGIVFQYKSLKASLSDNRGVASRRFILLPIQKMEEGKTYFDLNKIRSSIAHELVHLLADWGYLKDDRFLATVAGDLRLKELDPKSESLKNVKEYAGKLLDQEMRDEDLEEKVDRLILGDQYKKCLWLYKRFKWPKREPDWVYNKGLVIAEYLSRKYDDENKDKRWEYVRRFLSIKKPADSIEEIYSKVLKGNNPEVVFNLKDSPEYEEQVFKSGVIEDEIDTVLEKLKIDMPEKDKEELYKSVLPGTNRNILKTAFMFVLGETCGLIVFLAALTPLITSFFLGNIGPRGGLFTFGVAFVVIFSLTILMKFLRLKNYLSNGRICICNRFILLPILTIEEGRSVRLDDLHSIVAHELIHKLSKMGYVKDIKFMATVVEALRLKERNPMFWPRNDIEAYANKLLAQEIQEEELEEEVDKRILGDGYKERIWLYNKFKWTEREPEWVYDKGRVIAEYLCRKYPDEDADKRWEYVRRYLHVEKPTDSFNFFHKNNIALKLILAFSFIIRVWNLNYNVFWMDEGAFVLAGFLRIFNYWTSGMLFTPVVGESTRVAMKFGFNIVSAARFPNVIFGTAIVYLVFKLAQIFTDKLTNDQKVKEWIPIFAALITAISPGAWFISRYAVYDAMSYLLFGIGLLPFFKGVHEDKQAYLWLASVLITLSFATKYVILIYYPMLIIYTAAFYYKPSLITPQKPGFVAKIKAVIKTRTKDVCRAVFIEAFSRIGWPLLGMTGFYTYKYRYLVIKGILYSAFGTASYFPATTLQLLRLALVQLTPVILLLALIGYIKAKDKRTAGLLGLFAAVPLIYHVLSQHRLSINKLFSMSTITGLAILAAVPLAMMTVWMIKKINESESWKKKIFWGTSIPAIICAMMMTVFGTSKYHLVNEFQNWRNTREAQTFIANKATKHWMILAFENKWPFAAILYGKIPFENFHEQWDPLWEQHVRNGTYDAIFLDNKNRDKHLKALEIALTSGKYWIAKMDVPRSPEGRPIYYPQFETYSASSWEQLNLIKKLTPYYPKDDNTKLTHRAIATYVLLHKKHKPGLDKIKKIQERKKRKFADIDPGHGGMAESLKVGKTIPMKTTKQSLQNLSKKVDTAFPKKSYEHRHKPVKRTTSKLSGIGSMATIGLITASILFLNAFKSFAGVADVAEASVGVTFIEKILKLFSRPVVLTILLVYISIAISYTVGLIVFLKIKKKNEKVLETMLLEQGLSREDFRRYIRDIVIWLFQRRNFKRIKKLHGRTLQGAEICKIAKESNSLKQFKILDIGAGKGRFLMNFLERIKEDYLLRKTLPDINIEGHAFEIDEMRRAIKKEGRF
ncbi:MAG: hypothetical protein ABIH09_03520, partial [Candidatus Omnitrophota bacterium]